MPVLNDLAATNFDEDRTYGDVLHFVHVYVIEPHPKAPYVSPFTGDVWEDREFSTLPQAYDYATRVEHAKTAEAMLEGDQVLLVDDLDNDGRTNPVWCTYGPAPNAAYLIRQDGGIQEARRWMNPHSLREVIDEMLSD